MKMLQRYFLVLTILVAAGCSGLKFSFQDDLTYIDELVKGEKFSLALQFIDRQNKKSINYQRLQQQRPLILEEIRGYEQRILTRSKKLIKAQRWSDSIELLEVALENIPNSKKLARELKKQNITRDIELSQLKYQLTIHEARSIKADRKLYQRLYILDSNPSNVSMTPEIFQQRVETTTQELREWAKILVKQKQAIKARNTLKLAGELTPEIRGSSEFRDLIHEIEQIEKGISQAIKKKREIELDRRVRAFNRLFEQDKIIEAQIALQEIEKIFGKTEAIDKLRHRLDDTVSRKIDRHIANGKGFYSKEQIEYAINEWGHALLLDPDNREALEHMSRAVKVLEQLQKVRKNRQF